MYFYSFPSTSRLLCSSLIYPSDLNRSFAGLVASSCVNRFYSQSHYEVLGVRSNASQQEIKKAYYKQAQKLHPDKNTDPEALKKFQDLVHSYEVLTNESHTGNRSDYNSEYRKYAANSKNKTSYYRAENDRNNFDAKNYEFASEEGINLSRVSKIFHGTAAMCLILGILFGAFKGFKVQESPAVKDNTHLDDLDYPQK